MVKKQSTTESADPPVVSDKALAVLKVLKPASRANALPAKAVARLVWPERLQQAGTSLRRGGLYRAAGAYCSKLMRRGLVGCHIDDFSAGYYLTPLGLMVLEQNEAKCGDSADRLVGGGDVKCY